jgi:hypothetical protein
MARIEWIKLRLNNWALWKVRGDSGGLGWSSQSAFLNQTPSGRRESHIPCDDVDAALTDEAVESLKAGRPQLYETLQCLYAQGLGIRETCRLTGRGESAIKAHLDQADHALREWFNDRDERLVRNRAAAVLQK